MTGLIIIKKRAIKDPMLLEWIQNRELYERWEKECKPTVQKKNKQPSTTKKKQLKVEISKEILDRLQ